MRRRMNRLFRPDGRILIVAMDHTSFLDAPVPGLVDYGGTVRAAVTAGADAFLSPVGSLTRHADDYGPAAVIASVDATGAFGRVAVQRALREGADAVKTMLYPFADDDRLNAAATLAEEAARVGLPLVAEPIPGGFSASQMRSPETVAAGARIAMETGADVVKTFYPGTPEGMRKVVDYAGVPVVVLGGHRKNSLGELFGEVRDAVVDGGASGVAIGTNIWTSADPGGVVRGLVALLHEGASVEQAVSAAGDVAGSAAGPGARAAS